MNIIRIREFRRLGSVGCTNDCRNLTNETSYPVSFENRFLNFDRVIAAPNQAQTKHNAFVLYYLLLFGGKTQRNTYSTT